VREDNRRLLYATAGGAASGPAQTIIEASRPSAAPASSAYPNSGGQLLWCNELSFVPHERTHALQQTDPLFGLVAPSGVRPPHLLHCPVTFPAALASDAIKAPTDMDNAAHIESISLLRTEALPVYLRSWRRISRVLAQRRLCQSALATRNRY
jgi:hypothetical protein